MKTLEISEETYEKIKNQLGEDEKLEINDYADLIGKNWFIRTVTYHCTGHAVKFVGKFLQLEDAAWVADSGRFMDFIKKGEVNEVEPVGSMFVNIDSIVDFFPWKHKLLTEQK